MFGVPESVLGSRPGRRRHASVIAAPLLAILVLLAVVPGAGVPTARGATSVDVILGPGGIGTVRFGLSKGQVVASLRALFGAPAAHGVDTACGSRYTEVLRGDLAAEFRAHKFSGYRYLAGGFPLTTFGSPRAPAPKGVLPRLATARGITLGSTLRQLRRSYTVEHSAGTDRWRSGNGLIFVDNAEHDPEPPSSHIIEIKIGTCGDF